jgi:hypothetical protein
MAAITRKKRMTPPVVPVVTGEVEARVIALACSTGLRAIRGGLRLLEKHVVLADDLPALATPPWGGC